MAKKKAKKQFEFSKLNEFLSGVNPVGSLIHENEFIDTKEFISSGIYALDALLSTKVLKGGIPNNKVIAIGGQSGTGKTFLTVNFAKQAQLQGYYVIYLDSEGAIDNNLITNFGLDSNMFRIDPIATVEQMKIYMAKFIKKMEEMRKDGYELPKVLLVLDSMGNLASGKEVNDAEEGKEKVDMTRAKQLKSIFRIVTHKLGVLGIPMILTNHTYMSMDMYPREIFSGGCLNGDAKVLMDDGSYKEIQDIKKGEWVKTLMGPEIVHEKVEFDDKVTYEIEFDNGSKYTCSEDHRFLVNNDWTDDKSWKKVSEIKEEDEILLIENVEALNDIEKVLEEWS